MRTLKYIAQKYDTTAGYTLGEIRKRMALAMVGHTVGLVSDDKTIAHGVVTEVLLESGMPKIVVDGAKHNLEEILTVTPS